MKKSSYIKLVLLTAVISACSHKDPREAKVYMRADSTANYGRVHHVGPGMGYFYVFRPYGIYYNGSYRRAGFYSGSIPEKANYGFNGYKGTISRGGFGSSAFHVGS
jgi:hypothetical protein